MTSAVQVAIFSAALLAMTGAIFGVSLARVMWAEDLERAVSIDKMRSQEVKSLKAIIEIQKRRLGE